MDDGLTDKQQRFVAEYLVDLNATQAAIRAGYSPATAFAQASRLLSKVKVTDAVKEAMEKRSERTEITADRVLAEYARIAFYNPNRVYGVDRHGMPTIDFSNATEDDWRVVAEVSNETARVGEDAFVQKAKVKLHSKLSALDALAKHLGLNAPIQVEDVTQLTPEQRESRLAELRDSIRTRANREASSGP